MNLGRRVGGRILAVLAAAAMTLAIGCEGSDSGGSGDSGGDFGLNDRNVVVALGDSITYGYLLDGVPYPAQLSAMIGKNVVNAGVPGDRSSGGLSRSGGLLRRYHPGYMVIMLGANDAIHGSDVMGTIANLEAIVNACRANKTVPILCTLTPMTGPHALYQGGVEARNAEIRALGSRLKVRVARPRLDPLTDLVSDGLHPNQSGATRIASAVANVF